MASSNAGGYNGAVPQFREKDVNISVNLVDAALVQLDFLAAVDSTPLLYNPSVAEHAVMRYEKFWLPLVAQHDARDLLPPMDIRWAMHCHILAPISFKSDLLQACGRVPEFTCLPFESRAAKMLANCRQLWKRAYPDEPFDLDLTAASYKSPGHVSGMQYDIKGSILRQKAFFYQTSLPHYRDRAFLLDGLLRYKKYLFLNLHNPSEFLVPCYDMDIIWHSHMLHPAAYEQDTFAILGKVLNHDDSVNDRSEGSRLVRSDARTRELWALFFREDFFKSG